MSSGMFIAVEAIDLDPGDLGKLTYSVSDPLFTVAQDANSRTARILVSGWVVLLLNYYVSHDNFFGFMITSF